MSILSEALNEFLKEVADEPFSIKGNNRAITISLSDRTVMIDAAGDVFLDKRDAVPTQPAERPNAPQPTYVDPNRNEDGIPKELQDILDGITGATSALEEAETPEAPKEPHVPKFTSADVQGLYPLIDVKHVFTLDFDTKADLEDDLYDHPNNVGLGFFEPPLLKGNIVNYRDDKDDDSLEWAERRKKDDAWMKKRIRTFKQDDGEIGVEITYTPWVSMHYDDDEYLRLVYDNTNIATVISFEDFVKDVREEADWVDELFGGNEIYELFFYVSHPGVEPENPYGDDLFEGPLWIQRNGKKHNLHIFLHED